MKATQHTSTWYDKAFAQQRNILAILLDSVSLREVLNKYDKLDYVESIKAKLDSDGTYEEREDLQKDMFITMSNLTIKYFYEVFGLDLNEVPVTIHCDKYKLSLHEQNN